MQDSTFCRKCGQRRPGAPATRSEKPKREEEVQEESGILDALGSFFQVFSSSARWIANMYMFAFVHFPCWKVHICIIKNKYIKIVVKEYIIHYIMIYCIIYYILLYTNIFEAPRQLDYSIRINSFDPVKSNQFDQLNQPIQPKAVPRFDSKPKRA